MSAEKTPVYLILGAFGSGRRAILADLIEGGLTETDRPLVLLPADEPAHDADQQLPLGPRWRWEARPTGTIEVDVPSNASPIFFVTDGRRNPVDQLEAFKAWIDGRNAQVARIICVVNCQFAARHSSMLAWYEACVHFADVTLLNHREGVGNKWLSGFLEHFKKQHLPCIFEMVKAGRVKNPALILEPQARRMTQVFDEEQDWIFTDESGTEIDEQAETENEEEEVEAKPLEDPYFARRLGGRRVKELPDIASLLSSENGTADTAALPAG